MGFLPANDCAPVIVAKEYGIFEKYGLNVELRRRPSWKDIHRELAYRELEAAHAPAALPFLMNLGITPLQARCVTGLLLGMQGNAITISEELWRKGVRDAEGLGKEIVRTKGKRIFTFAVDLPFSSEYFLLCQWLREGGLMPLRTVRILKVPPSEMFPMLKLGYLDGYCTGEPWTSLAVDAGLGRCVSTSATLAPLHPEKALIVREDFAAKRSEEHERMIAALMEACTFCDREENREELCQLLAQSHYVNAPIECFEAGLVGQGDPEGNGLHSLNGLNIFQRYRANDPTASRAAWITGQLHRYFRWKKKPEAFEGIFRRDIFQRARKLVKMSEPREGARAVMCSGI
jgi:ABC-type nitrate/sulfonate/bicarbonate transport system substrate-binding protein